MPEGEGGLPTFTGVYHQKESMCDTMHWLYTYTRLYTFATVLVAPCRQHSLVAMGIAVYGNIILY